MRIEIKSAGRKIARAKNGSGDPQATELQRRNLGVDHFDQSQQVGDERERVPSLASNSASVIFHDELPALSGRVEKLAVRKNSAYPEAEVHSFKIHNRDELPFLQDTGDFSIVTLKGTPERMNLARGFLLAKEISEGALDYSLGRVRSGLAQVKNPKVRESMLGVLEFIVSELEESSSEETQKTLDAVYTGMLAGLPEDAPRHQREAAKTAMLAIEASSVLDATKYMIKKSGLLSAERRKNLSRLLKMFGRLEVLQEAGGSAIAHLWSSEDALDTLRASSPKVGCTSLGLNAEQVGDSKGPALVSNFDADLTLGWNKHPTLSFTETEGTIPGTDRPYLKFVGGGTAGIPFSGGIRGMNEAGLALSLHVMSPTRTDFFEQGDKVEIAPVLAQRILRESRDIEEAAEILRSQPHYGAWTLNLVQADGSRAHLEFSNDGVKRIDIKAEEAMTYTNDFKSEELGNYFAKAGKLEEVQTRQTLVHQDLASTPSQNRDQVWMANVLANMANPQAPGELQFGRGTARAYNVAPFIMRPSVNEFSMGIGNANGAASFSDYLTFKIDWEQNRVEMVDSFRADRHDDTPKYKASTGTYIKAREAYESGDKLQAFSHLSRARDVALSDGVDDLSYQYLQNRLRLQLGDKSGAIKGFKEMLEEKSDRLDALQKVNIASYLAVATALAQDCGAGEHQEAFALAESAFDEALIELKPDTRSHQSMAQRESTMEELGNWFEREDSWLQFGENELPDSAQSLAQKSLDFIVVS